MKAFRTPALGRVGSEIHLIREGTPEPVGLCGIDKAGPTITRPPAAGGTVAYCPRCVGVAAWRLGLLTAITNQVLDADAERERSAA